MKSRCRHILSVVAVLVFMSGTAQEGYAQKWRKNKKADKEQTLSITTRSQQQNILQTPEAEGPRMETVLQAGT